MTEDVRGNARNGYKRQSDSRTKPDSKSKLDAKSKSSGQNREAE
jgi:hypothetical protein